MLSSSTGLARSRSTTPSRSVSSCSRPTLFPQSACRCSARTRTAALPTKHRVHTGGSCALQNCERSSDKQQATRDTAHGARMTRDLTVAVDMDCPLWLLGLSLTAITNSCSFTSSIFVEYIILSVLNKEHFLQCLVRRDCLRTHRFRHGAEGDHVIARLDQIYPARRQTYSRLCLRLEQRLAIFVVPMYEPLGPTLSSGPGSAQRNGISKSRTSPVVLLRQLKYFQPS